MGEGRERKRERVEGRARERKREIREGRERRRRRKETLIIYFVISTSRIIFYQERITLISLLECTDYTRTDTTLLSSKWKI